MIKKIIIVLAILFLGQLIMSCIFCNCNDPETYEVNYTSIFVTAFNTAGFMNTEVEDSVYKNAFGISVSVASNYVISTNTESSYFTLGFNSVKACSCVDDTYIYPDPISFVEILVTDTETNQTNDVTSNFRAQSYYYNHVITLEQYFDERQQWDVWFQFDLVDLENIPDEAIFTINLYLESRTSLSEETKQINFHKSI